MTTRVLFLAVKSGLIHFLLPTKFGQKKEEEDKTGKEAAFLVFATTIVREQVKLTRTRIEQAIAEIERRTEFWRQSQETDGAVKRGSGSKRTQTSTGDAETGTGGEAEMSGETGEKAKFRSVSKRRQT